MEIEFKELLKDAALELGIMLNKNQIEKFNIYGDMLKEWNQKVNLTAIKDDREIIIKHFIDSISIAPIIKKSGVKIIDVGTGAGFPGIPIKIVYPDREIKLLDSLKKRLVFLNEIINNLGLVDISTVHCRAEDAGKREGLREMFDVSTARAVAALPVLLEYCLPLTKVGGYFIAMKGSNPTEVEDSKRALDILGAKIEDIKEFVLPFSDYKRNVVIIRKFRQTPTKYPRKSGKPSKDPLM